jgi:serine/threonine-protein kinase
MATVYLAHDVRHDRPVALKVLHADLAHALGPERFQREIRLAARLQHPHILTVHDSGESAGQLWFTMPFIEGESLRDRLSREKQLPIEDALRITREAADALDYAHQHGVIHRDIKPENILLSGNHALVADFGIARALTAGAGDQHLTETGTSIGTAAYMSPEQAAGERDLDARSDVYSLATVLYEMLAGQTPFTAATPQAMIARRFTETPKPLTDVRHTVPPAVAHAVQKALATTPADRYASAAEFARALTPAEATVATPAPMAAVARPRRRAPAALITLVLGFAIGLGVLFAWRRDHGSDTDGPRRLAVLPFENEGAASDDYFADGLTEEVRGKLTALPGLAVTASASSGQYRKSTKSLKAIAAELGVDWLLVGKVRWEKHDDGTSRVRVSPELIDARTGTAKWQEPFEAAITGVFQVQADIASQVASKLDVALTDSVKTRLEARPTQNVAAYDAYLRGGNLNNDPATLRANIAALEQAVALDPSFAQAWARLATMYSLLYINSVPTRETAQSARHALDRAMALAPNDPTSYLAAVNYYTGVEPKPDSARAALDLVIRLDPNNPRALLMKARADLNRGAPDSALVHIDGALARDPRTAGFWAVKVQTLVSLHRYAEARTAADRALQLAPGNLLYVQQRARVELLMGDLAAAREVLRSSGANPAELAAYMSIYYDLYWVLPDTEQDLVLRLPLAAFDDDRASRATVLAQLDALRGDAARARSYADTAVTAYDAQLRESPNDAQLHALRGLVLAYLGRKAEAIAEAQRAMALVPATSRGLIGSYTEHQLARIYIITGEPDKAIDVIEHLMTEGYWLSPGLLRIDPNFAPLRGNARFEALTRR